MTSRLGSEPALFLFDIDWTLLRGGTPSHRDAFAHAFRAIYDLPLSLDGISAAGRTDAWLLAEPLRRHGVPEETIVPKVPAAFALMQEYVEERLGDIRDWVLPGVRDVLADLHSTGAILGLLTGNLSRIAWAKMRHAGLDQYFTLGGFGEESETRAHLVSAALSHAADAAGRPFPPQRAVVIGDTPFDIEAGKSAGTRTVGVATGPFSVDALYAAGADLALPSFRDAERAVAELRSQVPGPET